MEKRRVMPSIIESKVNANGAELRLDNGVIITVCPNRGYFYFTLSHIELPTEIGPKQSLVDRPKLNNTLEWHYVAKA